MLVRSWYDRDAGTKRGTSLGVRSPETERVKAAFERRRADADQALEEANAPLDRISRVAKALRLGRLDDTGAEVLRELRHERVLDPSLYVIDSSAVAGYEAQAGVFMQKGFEADPNGLELCTTLQTDEGLFDDLERTLRHVDPSFRRRGNGNSYVNERRFDVMLHSKDGELAWADSLKRFDRDQREILAEAIEVRAIKTTAIAKNGTPVEMFCLDPRNFAVQHYAKCLSDLEWGPERAYAVGRLVEKHWPEKFPPSIFEAFPEFAAQVAPGILRAKDPQVEDPEVEDPDAEGPGGMRFFGP